MLIRELEYVLKCFVAASSGWTFLSSHGHVLVQLARSPDQTMRDIAYQVGLTERAVQLIVRDLADGGYVTIQHVGRRNSYTLTGSLPLRHPAEQDTTVGDLIGLLDRQPTGKNQ
jgi:DNA-binding MarR family transcriptional regulator